MDIQQQLEQLEAKIDAVYMAIEKMRRYFLIILWVTIAMVVLPILGLIFVIPMFLSTYAASFEGLL